MPIIETIGSGSARAFGRAGRNPIRNADLFKPAGTTRVLGLGFNESLAGLTSDSTYSINTTTTAPTWNQNGGASDGYASGFALGAGSGNPNGGAGFYMNSFPALNGVNFTFIAWYRGTQTNTGGTTLQYSPRIPIFGDPRGSVYIGFGIDDGRIAVSEVYGVRAGPKVNDGQWHMLAWTINSSNRISAFVDGYRQISDLKTYSSPTNNRADYIGQGYSYPLAVPPSQLDGVQVYSGILSEAQLQEIYTSVMGIAPVDNRVAARYWRWRAGEVTFSHTPRASRLILRDHSGTDYTVQSYTSDNCGDAGTIVSFGGTTTFTYDAGSGNTRKMAGAGLYSTFNGGVRGQMVHLDYSNDGSNWTEWVAGDLQSSSTPGCGIYLNNGQNP